MVPRAPALLSVLLVAAIAGCDGCDDRPAPAPPVIAAPTPSPSSAPTQPPAPSAAAAAKASMQILKMAFTSEVKNREPVDTLEATEPGQKVWVHLAVRNRAREARKITVVFRINGDERSTVSLDVEPSWSYRTWAYNTVRKTDRTGALDVEIRDDEGTMMTAQLPIRASSVKKPR